MRLSVPHACFVTGLHFHRISKKVDGTSRRTRRLYFVRITARIGLRTRGLFGEESGRPRRGKPKRPIRCPKDRREAVFAFPPRHCGFPLLAPAGNSGCCASLLRINIPCRLQVLIEISAELIDWQLSAAPPPCMSIDSASRGPKVPKSFKSARRNLECDTRH